MNSLGHDLCWVDTQVGGQCSGYESADLVAASGTSKNNGTFQLQKKKIELHQLMGIIFFYFYFLVTSFATSENKQHGCSNGCTQGLTNCQELVPGATF